MEKQEKEVLKQKEKEAKALAKAQGKTKKNSKGVGGRKTRSSRL